MNIVHCLLVPIRFYFQASQYNKYYNVMCEIFFIIIIADLLYLFSVYSEN